jgi:hypothetical protein
MAARNVTDPDLWWHLKTGEYIASTGPSLTPILFPTLAPESPGLRTNGLPNLCSTRFNAPQDLPD